MGTRCPSCGNIVVYDMERVRFACAICDSTVDEMAWPYSPEYLETIYTVKTATKEEKAKEMIRMYITEDTAVALSGKDSLVALHLVLSVGAAVDVVISAYIADRRLPQKILDELKAAAESLGARRVIIHDEPWDVHASLFAIINRKYGYGVTITGLRRRENRGHIHAVEYQLVEPGKVVKLINPVIDWSTAEVWSYIYHYRLPVLTPYKLAPPDASLQHLV